MTCYDFKRRSGECPEIISELIILNLMAHGSKTSIQIIDSNGSLWKKEIYKMHESFRLNISELPKGIYIVKIESCGFIVIRKFIKI